MPDDCTARPPCHEPAIFGHQGSCRLGPRSPEQLKAIADARRRQLILAHYGPWMSPEIPRSHAEFLGGIGI